DDPDFPSDQRAFALGHVAQLDVLATAGLDRVVLAPPPVLLDEAARTRRYRTGGTSALPATSFSSSYPVVALVDEAASPPYPRPPVPGRPWPPPRRVPV